MSNDCLMQSVSHYQGFGGVGESGSGRYGGREGYQNFSNRKGILIKQAQPASIRNLVLPPFTDSKVKMIERVFIFASLYNQSDVVFYLKIAGLIAALLIAYFWFM
jgi:hypothetical protein